VELPAAGATVLKVSDRDVEPLSALVVGAGSGGTGSIRALAESPRYTLRGVADISPAARQRVAAAHPDVAVFADHREALQTLQPDVVCVSTWPPSHVPVALDALAAGSLRGLLLEKPIADTWRDGRRLVDELRRRRMPCVVPHGLVVSSPGRAVIEQVRDGAIGALRLVWIECRGWDILNAGIHWLHFALQVLRGPFVEVQCACDRSTRTFRDGMQVETVASLVVTAADGARIALHTGDEVSLSAPAAGTLIRLVGDEGLIELPGWEPRYRIVSARHAAGRAGVVQVAAGPPPHAVYLDRLADQIAAGTPRWEQVERSLAALELCDAAYTSAREQRAVSLGDGNRLRAAPDAAGPGGWDPGRPYAGTGGGRDGRRLG
jgi:predicted dehydrogenase